MTDVIAKSERLLKQVEGAGRFSTRYEVYPYEKLRTTLAQMHELCDSIKSPECPQTRNELIMAELKRRMGIEALLLEQRIEGGVLDFNKVVSMFAIPTQDINGLKEWLCQHRSETIESINRLFDSVEVEQHELELQADIPAINRMAIEFGSLNISLYHLKIGKLLQRLTRIGEYIRDIRAVPTTQERSYFRGLTNTLAVSIPGICYNTEDGSIHLRERELIRIYGHEGMGHALNHLLSKSNGLPYFLTADSLAVRATGESLAQFYQRIIFEDLKGDQKVQQELEIKHTFEEIHQEAMDISLLYDYKLRMFQYGITVLADKTLGKHDDPNVIQEKIKRLSEVSIFPEWPRGFVEGRRNSFDSQGNLDRQIVAELQYCAQPVQRGLEEFAKRGIKYEGEGRSLIDATFLKGYWTPVGFVDNARIAAATAS